MDAKIIDEYIKCAELCKTTDYGNQNSVKLHNKTVKKMDGIVRKAAKEGVDAIRLIAVLLDNPVTKEWIAYQLLDEANLEADIEEKCLLIIREIAASDRPVDSFGAKVWLEKWEAKKTNKRLF